MKDTRVLVATGSLLLMLAVTAVTSTAATASDEHLRRYRVTLTNLTAGQPFSPPVAATHRPGLHMFEVGQQATDQLAAIAQDGNEAPMFNVFNGANGVTQTVDVGRPLTPHGRVVGSFTDTLTFEIMARRGDRLSFATMLICTNDGFLGLDGARLPDDDAHTFSLVGWDAGRENNTERQQDLVEPCSALGPVVLPGVHPSPNHDSGPGLTTTPPEPIHLHPGITGVGDLTLALHNWRNPVARVTISRLEHDDE
jgi:hypothetical protein